MANDINDLEITPAQAEEDEPLIIETLGRTLTGVPIDSPRAQLTSTGYLWIFVPWYFIIKKKLQFGLLDFLIFSAALGSSCSALLKWLMDLKVSTGWLIVIVYLLAHLNGLMLTSILYGDRRGMRLAKSFPRWVEELAMMGGFSLVIHFIVFVAMGK